MGQYSHEIPVLNDTNGEANVDDVVLVLKFLGKIIIYALKLSKVNFWG